MAGREGGRVKERVSCSERREEEEVVVRELGCH